MITSISKVKQFANLATRLESGAPTISDVGEIGDIWLDDDDESATFGKTWELVDITEVPEYVWQEKKPFDLVISLMIPRVERDFLAIRGKPFETDDLGATVYPDGAEDVAAEMVCFAAGLGRYEGRGMSSESTGGRSRTYEQKILSYPISIVGSVTRYQGTA